MASIIKKKFKGQVYYYAAKSKRVNGKPRIVWQKYLGKVGDIVEAVSSANTLPSPKSAKIYRFGAEAALLEMAKRLGVKDIINKHAGGLTDALELGEYILIYAINCCIKPGARTPEWLAGAVLRRHLNINPKLLTEKRYREVAGLLTKDVLGKIQADLAGRIYNEFGIGTRCLIYHDIEPPGIPAARSPRSEKNFTRIGLLVSSDFFIPLFYEIYQNGFDGLTSDEKYTCTLTERLRSLGRPENEIAVVKHICCAPGKINNGQSGISCHILGTLPKEDNKDLLGIPLERFHALGTNRRNKVMAYRCSKDISGENTTVLVVFSEKEMREQQEALTFNLQKCINELVELKTCLQLRRNDEGGRKTNLSPVKKRVEEILNKPLLKSMVDVSLACDKKGRVDLSYVVKKNPLTPAQERDLGKRIIFATNNSWDNEDIYSAFTGKWILEDALNAMKKSDSRSFKTARGGEECLRLDVFCTVLGLSLLTLLQRELHRYGITGSIPETLQILSGIREVAVIYTRDDQRVKKKEYITITQLDQKQKEIFQRLRLDQYAAGNRLYNTGKND